MIKLKLPFFILSNVLAMGSFFFFLLDYYYCTLPHFEYDSSLIALSTFLVPLESIENTCMNFTYIIIYILIFFFVCNIPMQTLYSVNSR